MTKRSKRRVVRQEKGQAGCMWGLISIFDFRHGRSTRKLLLDKKHGAMNNAAGTAYAILGMPTNSDEMCQSSENGGESEKPTFEAARTSVKELMEEEMFSEQDLNNHMNSAEVEIFDSDNQVHVEKNQKNANKTLKMPCEIHENSNLQVSAPKSSDYLDLLEEISLIYQKSNSCSKHGRRGGLDMQSNQAYSAVEEKLTAAIELLMNQKLSSGEIRTENGKLQHSKDFIDALQILSSNKELFLKLLQDPNSMLVKHIQGSEDPPLENNIAPRAGSNLLEGVPSNSRQEEFVTRKHRNFFRRKSKSQDSILLENEKSLVSSRIVILKPGRPDKGIDPCTDKGIDPCTSVKSHDKMENEVHSERTASHFSFMEIKKKLKHAMGKEWHGISPHSFVYKQQNLGDSEKGVEGTGGWSSPNRNHFFTEKFAKLSIGRKKGDRISKLRDSEKKIVEKESSIDTRPGVSNIYIEAKKHLSEMLSNGDEDAELMIGKFPKTLGRILSLPEYNYSPSRSPRKEREHSFVTAQMRLSPRGSSQTVSEVFPCISNDNPDEKVLSSSSDSEVPFELDHDNMGENLSSMREEISSEGVLEIVNTADAGNQEDRKIVDVSCEPCSSSNITDILNDETAAVHDDKISSQCLKLDGLEENHLSSSPAKSPSLASKTEELECPIDRIGRPSPISVLEPLFSDDDISPASTVSRRVETEIQPLHIHFEENVSPATDQEISIRTCMENEESAFEYVEAVLLASDLNWDEFLTRWLSSDQPLDPSLFDEVELFSNRSCHDQKLLFDCTNEILKEVCDRYLGFFLGVSFVKQNIRPLPKGMNLINEVWEGIELHLQNPYPRSLDQLVRKDLGKSEAWMDLRLETRCIVIEMEESILEDLMDDSLSVFMDDHINGSFSVPPAE